jgi:F-type H+-transporting ATPase subunit a
LSDDTQKEKRFGVKRWIVLALIAVGIYVSFMGPTFLRPITPVVVLPPEPTGLAIGNFQITNTILATLLADLVLLLLAFGAWRFSKRGKLVPEGTYNSFEAIVEFLWNSVEGSAGKKWAMRMFPVVATIFLLVFSANMVKLIPGFEAIGQLKAMHIEGTAYEPKHLFDIGSLGVYSLDKGHPVEVAASHGEENTGHGEEASEDSHGEESASEICHACEVVPFLRGSATDLNFTFALAFIAVFMTQVFGVWALGVGYFKKFFPIDQLISGGIFGGINFAVGLLEIILEFAKILSFGFRLFGNVFAGALLLSIIGVLTAVGLPAGLYLFEIFFGIIQAYVFFLLATVFISGALESHH